MARQLTSLVRQDSCEPGRTFPERCPATIDLAQAGVSSALRNRDQAIDTLNFIKWQCCGREVVDAYIGFGKEAINQFEASGSRRKYSSTSSSAIRSRARSRMLSRRRGDKIVLTFATAWRRLRRERRATPMGHLATKLFVDDCVDPV